MSTKMSRNRNFAARSKWKTMAIEMPFELENPEDLPFDGLMEVEELTDYDLDGKSYVGSKEEYHHATRKRKKLTGDQKKAKRKKSQQKLPQEIPADQIPVAPAIMTKPDEKKSRKKKKLAEEEDESDWVDETIGEDEEANQEIYQERTEESGAESAKIDAKPVKKKTKKMRSVSGKGNVNGEVEKLDKSAVGNQQVDSLQNQDFSDLIKWQQLKVIPEIMLALRENSFFTPTPIQVSCDQTLLEKN